MTSEAQRRHDSMSMTQRAALMRFHIGLDIQGFMLRRLIERGLIGRDETGELGLTRTGQQIIHIIQEKEAA